jgi:alpha-glucosidase
MKKINSNKTSSCIFILLFTYQISTASDKIISLFSPDKKTEIKISLGEKIHYSVLHNGKVLITPSSLSMTYDNGKVIGTKPKLANQKSNSINNSIKTLYGTTAELQENYNELSLEFRNDYSLVFRVFNEGAAYRFITKMKGQITIINEEAVFSFPDDYMGFYIAGKKNQYLYEGDYNYWNISRIDSGRITLLPIVIDTQNDTKVAITESDLIDYPGMYLEKNDKNSLKSYFNHYPLKTDMEDQVSWAVHVKDSAGYIAKTSGSRSFPWRIIMIAEQDKDLMKNELVYLLASEQKKNVDFSWVKSGKIVNDWWDILPGSPQELILTGVDFKSGMNYETYKYNIDFASEHNIEFVNIDYGWSDPMNFSKIHPNLDLQKLLSYSKEKNKKVMLWCIAKTLYSNLEENMSMFEKWGIAGLKVDFFEREDQLAVNDYISIADAAARHHLLIEYHGASKPTGLSRTYPNVLTYEAVKGSEWNKVSDKASPDFDVTMPFIRTLAGPFDYGPGVMRNVSKSNFCSLYGCSMSQGTRCHQLAMFIIYYSPLQFMVDVPTTYIKEPVYLDFLASLPSVWDLTYPLDSKIGQYITIARKKGNNWFVGSMTNWEERKLTLKCDFLDQKEYNVEIFQDGLNANLNGIDYKRNLIKVKQGDEITIKMAKGGGWAAIFKPL